MDAKFDIKAKFEKLSGGKCLLSTTPCITNELNNLGEEFRSVFVAARRLRRENCKHDDGFTDPATCIKALMGHHNPDKLMVATQDSDLYKAIEDLTNVPVMTFANFTLELSSPSDETLERIDKQDKKKKEDQPMKNGKFSDQLLKR